MDSQPVSPVKSKSDLTVAAMAFGFTIGFGFLTTWEAIKQTQRNRNPLRSSYIYMIWGEIVANIGMMVSGWLWIDQVVPSDIPILFLVLFFWVFQVQLLMQIIVNRIAIIAEHRKTISIMKWTTAGIMTCVNIAVFCIFIPAHRDPPVSQLFVDINNYWDRASKFIIMALDGFLNWYFLRTVEQRLVKQHNLKKYKPLVSFNARLMALSIAMDAMLIGLMWLENKAVFIQFHPVTYMVKLNIEMSMAKLITRLASNGGSDEFYPEHNSSSNPTGGYSGNQSHAERQSTWNQGNSVALAQVSKIVAGNSEEDLPRNGGGIGIHRRTEIEVKVEQDTKAGYNSKSGHHSDDEFPLTSDTGHPKDGAIVRVKRADSSTSRES
ncbi:hypothetical protein V2G26_018504 [Clonostachys chloroleuca]